MTQSVIKTLPRQSAAKSQRDQSLTGASSPRHVTMNCGNQQKKARAGTRLNTLYRPRMMNEFFSDRNISVGQKKKLFHNETTKNKYE